MTATEASGSEAPGLKAPESKASERVVAARSAELRRALPQWVALASGSTVGPARNPSLPTLVGLLILILCFFVILTSASLRDHKRENSVMSSLQQTFDGKGAAPRSDSAKPDSDMHRILGDLRASITAQVPLITGAKPVDADDLVLELPRNLVFAPGNTGLAGDFPHILRQTRAALRAGPDDFAYEVEVAIQSPAMDDAAVASGALLGDALRKAGFADDTGVVSLSEGTKDAISLIVRLRPNARVPAPGAE